jgi:hypothetical protein
LLRHVHHPLNVVRVPRNAFTAPLDDQKHAFSLQPATSAFSVRGYLSASADDQNAPLVPLLAFGPRIRPCVFERLEAGPGLGEDEPS